MPRFSAHLTFMYREYLGEEPRRVGHMQTAGVPDRHEPDTGELNDSYPFDVIDETGYNDRIWLEYLPVAGTSEVLDWLRNRRVHQQVARYGDQRFEPRYADPESAVLPFLNVPSFSLSCL